MALGESYHFGRCSHNFSTFSLTNGGRHGLTLFTNNSRPVRNFSCRLEFMTLV